MADLATSQKVIPAIMIGGSGTRLWPLSRGNMPKQFLCLTNEKSLFQNTLERVTNPVFDKPWLLTGQAFVETVLTQAEMVDCALDRVVLEPMQRGTAAALATIAVTLEKENPDALVLAMPADHVIKEPELFIEAVTRALPLAEGGKIVTFGIVPTHPETGFGYIRPGHDVVEKGAVIGALVEQPGGFLEKPDLATAQSFVEAGYLWNAGIFLFKASVLADEIKTYAQATYAAVDEAVSAGENRELGNHIAHMPSAAHFAACPDDVPIDIAVMEKSHKVAVVPCDNIGWADIGSLDALWEISDKTDAETNNAIVGDGLAIETRNCFIHAQTGRKVVLGYVDDLMVVDSEDVVVVLPRHQAQRTKEIVKRLKAEAAKQVNYTRVKACAWGMVHIEQTLSSSQICSLVLNAQRKFTYRVSDVATDTFILSGDVTAEFAENGRRGRFKPGDPVTFKAGQVITLQAGDEQADFTYIRHKPDFNRAIGDWFPQVQEVKFDPSADYKLGSS